MPKIYIKSRQMRDIQSVEYQGRCYVPTGDTIKLSEVSIVDINNTTPYYGACVACRGGEMVLTTTQTTPISTSMAQLRLNSPQTDDTFVMSMTAGDQTIDYLAIRVDPTGMVVYSSNSSGRPVGPIAAIDINTKVNVKLASNSSISVSQPKAGVYLITKSIQVDFTTLVVTDPGDPAKFAAPYQRVSTQVLLDPYTSTRYELKINDTVQDVNATGDFTFITTGNNETDNVQVVGYDSNDSVTTVSNTLLLRSDNVLSNPPVEHAGLYYAGTSDTYNFSTTDTGNNNLEIIRDRLLDYGFVLNRVVRVQDFITNNMLWDVIGTNNIIGKVVSNYNNIVDRYSYANKCIFLTNSDSSESVSIYHENTVLNCKSNSSTQCDALKGNYLTSHGTSKPVLVSFTT